MTDPYEQGRKDLADAEQATHASYYRWLREHGCILLPPSSGDEMLTARMLDALDEKMASLVANN